MRHALTLVLISTFSISLASAADREVKAVDRIDASANVVNALLHQKDNGIPTDLLDKARCVVVIPGMKKVGFIIAGKYGKGFAVCRNPSGHGWTAPAAVQVEGGSVGFQIGATDEDIVMLVMNNNGMNHLLADKFTLGGTATGAAGPIGRTLSAQTDASMHADILSYSRAGGVFAGIALEGATLLPDKDTNRELYGRDITNREILTDHVPVPAGARRLDEVLNHDSHTRT